MFEKKVENLSSPIPSFIFILYKRKTQLYDGQLSKSNNSNGLYQKQEHKHQNKSMIIMCFNYAVFLKTTIWKSRKQKH